MISRRLVAAVALVAALLIGASWSALAGTGHGSSSTHGPITQGPNESLGGGSTNNSSVSGTKNGTKGQPGLR
jgi:hypothetical protein